jgi:hypothetical protein
MEGAGAGHCCAQAVEQSIAKTALAALLLAIREMPPALFIIMMVLPFAYGGCRAPPASHRAQSNGADTKKR